MHTALREFKAGIFHALAHPTRIAIAELLRDNELSASELINRLGIEQANASQHLAVLRTKQVLKSRKSGVNVYYSLRDPALAKVLDLLKDYFFSQLSESVSMLRDVRREAAKK